LLFCFPESVKSSKSLSRQRSFFYSKELTLEEEEHLQNLENLQNILSKAWHVTTTGTKASLLDDILNGRSWRARVSRDLAYYSRSLLDHYWFNVFTVTFLTFVAALAGMEIQYANDTTSAQTATVFNIVDWMVFAVFAAEIIIRFTATEFHAKQYLSDGWNVFDVAVTVATGTQAAGTINN
jgi:Ion transport protein